MYTSIYLCVHTHRNSNGDIVCMSTGIYYILYIYLYIVPYAIVLAPNSRHWYFIAGFSVLFVCLFTCIIWRCCYNNPLKIKHHGSTSSSYNDRDDVNIIMSSADDYQFMKDIKSNAKGSKAKNDYSMRNMTEFYINNT